MPIAAFVVRQGWVDSGVVEVKNFLAWIAVVVLRDKVRYGSCERGAVTLSDEPNAGIDRLLNLDQGLLGIQLIIVRHDLELAAGNTAPRVRHVGEIIKRLKTNFTDTCSAAR